MKDHEISILVNTLTERVRTLCPDAPQQLRETIRSTVINHFHQHNPRMTGAVPIMESVEIEIGKELGRFESLGQWINHAQRVYKQAYEEIKSHDVLTLDSATPRRVILRGLQFEQAEKDSTYPAVIYAIKEK